MTADFFRRAAAELDRAATIHRPRFASLHEAMAVLAEEVHEVWQHVRAKTPDSEAIYTECVQVAAMAAKMAALCELPEMDTPDPQPAQDREGHDPWEITREDENALRSDYPGSASYSEIAEHAVARVRKRVEAEALARIGEVEGERESALDTVGDLRSELREARAEVERLRERLTDAQQAGLNWKRERDAAWASNEVLRADLEHHRKKAQPPAPVRGPDGPVTGAGDALAEWAEEHCGSVIATAITEDADRIVEVVLAALAATPTGAGGRVRVSNSEIDDLCVMLEDGGIDRHVLRHALRVVLDGKVELDADALEQGQEVEDA